MEIAENWLNESLDNLDKLLLNIREGRREIVLEKLAIKFGLLESEKVVVDSYSKDD